nr:MAG TPA: hypothetical protein [Caudoviricetes sp.]
MDTDPLVTVNVFAIIFMFLNNNSYFCKSHLRFCFIKSICN